MRPGTGCCGGMTTPRAHVTAGGGEVVDPTGDGFFAAFVAARPAVDGAASIQRALAEHRRTSGFALAVRIGLHSAEASHRGSTYSGSGVHTAARVADLAGARRDPGHGGDADRGGHRRRRAPGSLREGGHESGHRGARRLELITTDGAHGADRIIDDRDPAPKPRPYSSTLAGGRHGAHTRDQVVASELGAGSSEVTGEAT